MTRRFKVGDKVRCVNKKGNKTSCLVIGRIYTIKNLYSDYEDKWLYLEGLGGRWSDYQFILEERQENVVYGIAKFCKEYYK